MSASPTVIQRSADISRVIREARHEHGVGDFPEGVAGPILESVAHTAARLGLP